MAETRFGIVVEIDPTKAARGSASVGEQLSDLTEKSKRTQASFDMMTDQLTLGMNSIFGATKRVSDSVSGLGNLAQGFRGIGEQVKRDMDMLQRIHGPMQQLQEDMRTLESLHARGAISAKQYADELSRVGKTAGLSRANPMDAVSLKMPAMPDGDGASGMAGLASGMAGSLLPMVGAGTLLALKNLGDQYVVLENSVQKFSTATRSATSIMAEQRSMSADLRVDMAASIQLFDAVEGATADMLYTQKEQLDLQRNLGMLAQNEGKGLGAAAAMMERLEYAMSVGAITGRELKTMMKEMPDLADIWTKSLGVTRKELLAMAEKGKLPIKQLVDAVRDSSQPMEQFEKRTRSLGDRWRELMSVNPWEKLNDPASVQRGYQMFLQGEDRVVQQEKLVELTLQQANRTALIHQAVAATFEANEKMLAILREQNDVVDRINRGMTTTMSGAVNVTNALIKTLATGTMPGDTWGESAGLDRFNEAMEASKKAGEEYKAVLQGIRGEEVTYARDLRILGDLYARNRIRADEYNSALRKLSDTVASGTAPRGRVGNAKIGGIGVSLGMDEPTGPAAKSDAKSLADMGIGTSIDTSWMDDLITRQRAVEAQTGRNRTATEKWNDELALLRSQAAGTSIFQGLKDGFNSLADDLNPALQAQKLVKDGFDGISNAIGDMVSKGKADWSGLVKHIVAEAAKLALTKGLLAAFGGGGGGQAGGGGGGSSLGDVASAGVSMIGTMASSLSSTPGGHVSLARPAASSGSTERPVVNTTVVNVSNQDEAAIAAMNTRKGEAVTMNNMMRNRDLIRGHGTKR